MHAFLKWLRDNSLSIVFFALFLAFITLESVAGLRSYNDTLHANGLTPIRYLRYLGTGTFLDGIFTNWQAALLQLLCLVVFGSRFYQRGASHSRTPGRASRRRPPRGRRKGWLFRHSLGIVLGALTMVAFVAHIEFGSMANNETRRLTRQVAISAWRYLGTGAFWFTTTQTWEAEFGVIGAFLVLSIFLRQEGSPESKPVDAGNKTTGEVEH